MSENILLSAYTWTDSSNNIWPICNTKFIYGTLGSTYNVEDTTNGVYYTGSSTIWGSLNVASISQGNSNLVKLSPFTDKLGVTRYTISVNQSGIYRIRTTLTFSGINFTSGTNIYFKFGDLSNNNTALPIDSTSNPNILSLSSNQILSLGYVYTNNSSSYPSIVNTLTSYLPYFTLIPTYSTSTTFLNNGFSVIEQILYLPFNTPLYFNIASVGSNTYVNSTGNFTFELLSFSNNPTITNSVNISNNGILNKNGYNYIEFTPTSSVSGTATISFPLDVNLNFLLVGGGGGAGGAGSITSNENTYSVGGGGGGGCSAINGSASGTTFNISVGNYGIGGYYLLQGTNGYNSSIGSSPSNNNIAIAYGGGGGGSYSGGSSQGGGVWNPVPDPSGNGTKYLAANGGQGYFNIYKVSTVNPSSGLSQLAIDLSFNTYLIGGAGGGGGEYNCGNGGSLNNGGAGPGTGTGNGTPGSGYGTGGGGAQMISVGEYIGGNGGPGLVVLYW
jgi:hypothetical protein